MLKKIYRILVAISLVILTLRLINVAVKRGHPLPEPARPNGYEALLAAANLLHPPPGDVTEFTTSQVQSVAEQNRSALAAVRAALDLPSQVPIKPTKAWDDNHLDELKSLKKLAVALAVESRADLLQQHTNAAAHCDLDVLRLAQSLGQGGLLIDGVTSLAIETIGAALLQGKLDTLEAATCRDLATALETLDDHREKPEQILRTEHEWSRARFGLVGMVGDLFMHADLQKRRAEFVKRSHDVHAHAQRLMVRFAARACELEHQHPPTTVADLVPKYLKAAPKNWETGQEILEIPPPLN